jgi:hypothetical protein
VTMATVEQEALLLFKSVATGSKDAEAWGRQNGVRRNSVGNRFVGAFVLLSCTSIVENRS